MNQDNIDLVLSLVDHPGIFIPVFICSVLLVTSFVTWCVFKFSNKEE